MASSDIDLIELSKMLKIKLNGIYCKDELHTLTYKNGGYILNLDNSDGIGTHWTAFYIDFYQCYYFDSFGIVFPEELINWSKDKIIYYNVNHIQDINDNHCGYYCILFLYYFQHNKTYNRMETFVNLFTANPKKNVMILKKYLKQIL